MQCNAAHELPSTAAHLLHSLPCWTVDCCCDKPQEMSVLLLQALGDDLLHFSIFAGLVVALRVFVF